MGLPNLFVRADQLHFAHNGDPSGAQDLLISLNKEDSNHLIKSLRAKKGELLSVVLASDESKAADKPKDRHLIDVDLILNIPTKLPARVLHAEIQDPDHNHAVLKVLSEESVPRKGPVIVLTSFFPRLPTFEMILRSATELGAGAIIGVEGRYSETKVSQMYDQATRSQTSSPSARANRLHKVIQESAKQSRSNFIPELFFAKADELFELLKKIFVNKDQAASSRNKIVILDKTTEQPELLPITISDLHAWDAELIFVVVGPEGGFNDYERSKFRELHAQVLQISSNRLRTETAVCAGLGAITGAVKSSWTT